MSKGNVLGRLLQERREALGYSRTRLGQTTGIKPGTIEGWELGRVSKPPIHDVLRLARFLGVSLAEIERAVLGDEPTLPRQPESDRVQHAVPLLEQAIEIFNWDEEQVAAALQTTPAKVRAWRRGSETMTLPELMTLAALIGFHAASTVGGTRVADVTSTLRRRRGRSAAHSSRRE